MRTLALSVALTVLAVLTGCTSGKPASSPVRELRSQPDNGRLDDYLHFAGLSYGDSFEAALELFGEPTEVELNEGRGGRPYYSFATARFEIDGERCLSVYYDKATRKVEVISVTCDDIRIQILKRGIDDPKLALFGAHRRRLIDRYGEPASSHADNYEYNFGAYRGPRGLVTFICYRFWDQECREISVHWFY